MNAKSILVLSLLANCALLGAVGYLVKGKSRPDTVAPAAEAKANTKVITKTTSTVVTNQVVKLIDWRMVESEDYRKYIANLRAIGCPEETIRDIIIADVNKLFEERKKALRKPEDKFKYWETGMQAFTKLVSEDVIKQRQALAQEKRALLKDLLGVDVPEKPEEMAAAMNPFEAMLDFLPPEKQSKVMELMQQFQAKAMKSMSGGSPDAEDMKNMQKAQKEMEAELAKIMTPQEFEDYQLRLSQTSMMMRMQLDGFNPSEQEFKDIFKMRKQFDDDYGLYNMGGLSKEDREKRDAAQKELDNNVKQLLGEDRYADYKREQDYAYKGMAKAAQRAGLSKDAAVKAYDMKKIAEDQASKVRNDKSLTSEQRQTALQGIRQETERSIQQVFGDQAFQSYKNGNNAYWLKGLSPDPKQ